jgi:hypothetical protein
MRTQTKYNIGDIVKYTTVERHKRDRKCKACNSIGYVKHDGHEFRCISCNGMGSTYREYNSTVRKTNRIHRVTVKSYAFNDKKNMTEITYGIVGTYNEIKETDIQGKVKKA